MTRAAELAVLADGAKWIRNELEKDLPGAAGVLDVCRAGEHLHAAAVPRHGRAGAEAWYTARRRTPLGSGAAGLLVELATEPEGVSESVNYLGLHVGRTP